MALDNADSVWDYVITVWLLLTSVLFIFIFVVLLKKNGSYAALRYKHIGYLYGIIICGFIASWSTYISNDHLTLFDPIRKFECSFWSYWMTHVFGVNMWFVIMFLRLSDQLFIFHQKLIYLKKSVKKSLRITIFFVFITIPVLIASNVSYAHLSTFSDQTHSCESLTSVKIIVICWYIFCWILFNSIFLYLERDIQNAYFNEYLTLNHIVGVGQYVFVTNICVNLFGVVHYDYGRFIFTFNINFLFLFTILRICGYALYKAIRKDKDYEENVTTNFLAYDRKYLTLLELSSCRTLFQGYCRYADERTEASSKWILQNLIECVKDIEDLKTSSKKIEKQMKVMDQYFKATALFNLRLEEEKRIQVADTSDLKLGKQYALEKLQKDFWGKDYLKMINDEADQMFHNIQLWTHPKRHNRKKHKPSYEATQNIKDRLSLNQFERLGDKYFDEDLQQSNETKIDIPHHPPPPITSSINNNNNNNNIINQDDPSGIYQDISLKEPKQKKHERVESDILLDKLNNIVNDTDSSLSSSSSSSDDEDDNDKKQKEKQMKHKMEFSNSVPSITHVSPHPSSSKLNEDQIERDEEATRMRFLQHGVSGVKKVFNTVKSKLYPKKVDYL